MVFLLQFSVRDKPPTLQHSRTNVKPLPIGFPTAVADLPYSECKIKCEFLLAVGTLKKIVKPLFRNFTLNRRGREKNVIFFSCVMMKNSNVILSTNVWVCHPLCIYSEAKLSSVYNKWFLSYDTKRTCPVSFFAIVYF